MILNQQADLANQDKGIVRQDETVWFYRDHVDSSLLWQQALLADETVRATSMVKTSRPLQRIKGRRGWYAG